MRLLLPVLCAAAVLWLLPVWAAGPSVADVLTRPARSVLASYGCKPAAPIVVTVEPLDGDGPGTVRVRARMQPLLEMDALDWHWELSVDVQRMQGEPAGAGAPDRGAVTEEEFVVRVPDDGRYHRAELVVRGRLRAQARSSATDSSTDGSAADEDEPEWVTAVAALTWGEPAPPTPVVLSTDAETGASVPFLALPARHVPAAPGGR